MKKMVLTLSLSAAIALCPATTVAAQSAPLLDTPANITEDVEHKLPLTLRSAVQVKGKQVLLGDIFMGAGEAADIPVAFSPEPGRRTVFGAAALMRITRRHGLEWKPLSRYDSVTVERKTRTLDTAEIIAHVRDSLIIEGAPEDCELIVSNRSLDLEVAADAEPRIIVRNVQYKRRIRRFSADVEIDTGANLPRNIKVNGRLYVTTDIPVLSRHIAVGNVITEDDIEWATLRSDRLRRGVVADIDVLVGKEARRPLQAGVAINLRDITKPLVVEKGELITLTLATRYMKLTAKGQAMQDGSTGEVIRFKNIKSEKVVMARVEENGTATVSDMVELAMR